MPRPKAAPSRKRPLDEDAAAALPLDDATIAAEIERAEIEGVESRIASGTCRPHTPDELTPAGLVRIGSITDADFAVFAVLHATICDKLGSQLTGWGGVGDTSGRLRGYGYLPFSSLAEAHYTESHVMKEYTGAG